MTKERKTPLTTEQLLQDDRFVQAVLTGSVALANYQEQYLSHLPDSGPIVDDARQIIICMRQHYQSQSPSQKTLEAILGKIRSS